MNQQIQETFPAVPLLDLKATYQEMREELETVVINFMRKTQYIMGPEIAELEAGVAGYCGVKHAVGVASGSDAILLSLMALGIGQNDEVITTPFTFFATAGSISRLGARPVFVDIDPRTFNLAPSELKARITSRTKAIMPVHIFGQCAEMDLISAIAAESGIPVIEDAAQALGATYKNKRAGSMGDFGCFSFFPSKNLGGIGDGGMITTNNEDHLNLLKSLRVHGHEPGRANYHNHIGCNSRLDTIQAAVLLVKLKRLDDWHNARRANAALYDSLLADVPDIKTPYISEDCASIYNQYSILAEKRDDLRKILTSRNIGSAIYYPLPLHRQACYQELGYRQGDFPNAEDVCSRILSLPVYPGLTEDMVKRVAGTIKEFYRL